ncbi:ATP-binding protein [Gordonia sp. ABSL11-1]|uniref:sensor histidine kinase n=1 Tax=Gordonia sp. ABSL11-1 TaxID=3053924 RepID=UPI002573961E|nr:ATP-binding protein [Gordonia sp. ABSL11-1]MDL9944891.1 ATP-binding protein [Gordonia sp. ABSL11-1]
MVVLDRRIDVRRAAGDYLEGFRSGVRSDDSDVGRLERVGTRFVGLGLLVFIAVMIPVAIGRAGLTATWWTPLSMVLVAGPPILMVIVTFRPVPRGLVPLAGACSIGYIAATLLWFVAWNGATEPERWAVWLVQFPPVASIALVLVSRTRWALAHLVVATLLVHVANQLGRHGEVHVSQLLSAPLTITLGGVFVAVAYATTRNVWSLDARRADMLAAAATAAADMAAEAERARFAALIHDNVIAALLAVRSGTPDPRLIAQAAAALDELDRSDEADHGPVGAAGFSSRLREIADTVSDQVHCHLVAPEEEPMYPYAVMSAISESTGEAIRNWRRHAGPGTRCEVAAEFGPDTVRVLVRDNGIGFDPAAIRPERFGVAVGIRGRMETLPGGSAEINSAPGRGTTVVLDWRRP